MREDSGPPRPRPQTQRAWLLWGVKVKDIKTTEPKGNQSLKQEQCQSNPSSIPHLPRDLRQGTELFLASFFHICKMGQPYLQKVVV